MKTRQMGAIPPSAILDLERVLRDRGGISHWDAKLASTWTAPRVAATSYSHPCGRANVVAPCWCIPSQRIFQDHFFILRVIFILQDYF